MDNSVNNSEETTKKRAEINLKGVLIASILFVSGWALGNVQGPILTPNNSSTIALIIIAVAMAVLIHNKKV